MKCRFTGCLQPLAFCAAFAFAGCNATSTSSTSPQTHAADHDHGSGDVHEHAAEGPHHGQLIELGQGEFHAELTHDDATKTVTLYLLDKDAKQPVTIADPEITLNLVVAGKPTQVKLAASPQEGDAAGQSSRFSIADQSVIEALDATGTTGRLNVTISGQAYSGAVEHHEHGGHEH
jgi:hypothetical protein